MANHADDFDRDLDFVISEALGDGAQNVSYDTNLADSGLDSFMLSNLVLAVEEHFKREIDAQYLEEMVDAPTLNHVRKILKEALRPVG